MSEWTQGYRADVEYTYGYYPDLNPLRIQLAFLNAGLVPPKVVTACELGFGQGISVNMHAAASVTTWFGTDFNPSHAAFAQDLAVQSGAKAQLFDESFEVFCAREALPDFDFIAIHGIWSWVSAENRQHIVDFIGRKLKVGGVLYLSYNTQPGWAAMVPMRELLNAHAESLSADGAGILPRIEGALSFAERLLAVEPQFIQANPQVAQRIANIKQQNNHYVAHEYFNTEWHPMSFRTVAQALAPAKLTWACSAQFMDAIDIVNLTQSQQALLASIPDPMFRQTVRDFCINQQFRRDYWVKGPRTMSALDQKEALRALRLLLIQPRDAVSLKVRGYLGEAALQASVYGPILDALSAHEVMTLGRVVDDVSKHNVSFSQVVQGVMLFVASGAIALVTDEVGTHAVATARELNNTLMQRARSHSDLGYLASPVIAGGVPVSRFHQLFLLSWRSGNKQPRSMAKEVFELLQSQGMRLMKDNQPLVDDKDSMKELERQATDFAKGALPLYQVLKLA